MSDDLRFGLLAEHEQPLWDTFAAAHPRSDFAQASAWGRVKARGEWQAVRAGVFAADSLVAGAQVLVRPLPGGRSLAYACRGPLVDLETLDGAAARATLFDGLERYCRERNAICLKCDPCVAAEHTRFLELCGLRRAGGHSSFGGTQPRFVMRLDLRPGAEAVFGGFRPDYRNRIRKGERRGVTVRAARDDDWAPWYELLLETAERQTFRVRARSYFEAVRDELRDACAARLLLAEREERLVGGILCVAYGGTVWYLYGAMNDEGREHYSGYLLQWEAMRWALERGAHTYDFRGVAPPDQTESHLYNLNRFKSGFGPELVEWVGEWDLVLAPLWYRGFTVLLPRARAWLKRRR